MFYLENYELENGISPAGFSHLGLGAFETLRGRRDRDCFKFLALERHLERLDLANKYVKSNAYGHDRLLPWLAAAVRIFADRYESDCRLRIVLTREKVSLFVEPWFEKHTQLKLMSMQIERCMPELKSCSALPSLYSAEKARLEGFDEALLIDRGGVVRESSWGNFFWLDGSERLQSSRDWVLPGITRSLILNSGNFPAVHFKELQIGDLPGQISGAFVTRATDGVLPVVQIDQLKIPISEKIFAIKASYEALFLKSELPVTEIRL